LNVCQSEAKFITKLIVRVTLSQLFQNEARTILGLPSENWSSDVSTSNLPIGRPSVRGDGDWDLPYYRQIDKPMGEPFSLTL